MSKKLKKTAVVGASAYTAFRLTTLFALRATGNPALAVTVGAGAAFAAGASTLKLFVDDALDVVNAEADASVARAEASISESQSTLTRIALFQESERADNAEYELELMIAERALEDAAPEDQQAAADALREVVNKKPGDPKLG
jgi:hypothetical protein